MRRVLASLAALLVSGCAAGPHTSGALWALDEARLEEDTVYRVPEPQRISRAREVELAAVSDLLAAEAARLQARLATCPGPTQDVSQPSPGNQARDAARLKAGSAQTPSLRDWAGRLAQADWYLRRGAATGDPAFCQRARQALATQSPPEQPGQASPEPPAPSSPKPPPPDQPDQSQPDAPASDLVALVQALPAGEVDSGPDFASGEVIDGSADPYQALAMYRLGLVDGVRGPAPLVAHLAAVYGGSLHLPPGRLNLDLDLPPEQIVDAVAPALAADWEPDALYAALRAARPSLGTRRTRRPDDRLSTVDSQDSVGEFRSRLGRDQPLRCAGRVDAPPARGVDVRRATSPTESCQLSIVDCRLAMTRV